MVEKIIIIVFGMAWGSFLNVVIYRLPRKKSLMRPPSSCPQCGKQIRFYFNIPVISYLFLRGKCRFCRAKIPFSYLLVEILTPVSFILLYNRYGLQVHFFVTCLFATALIVLGFIDFYHQILPDVLTFPGITLALGYSLFRSDLTFLQAVIGAAAGAGILLFIYGAYYLVRKKEGLGMGDVTMMLMVGAFLGWRLAFFTLIIASFAGAITGVFIIIFKKKDLQFALPFGTFIAPAAFLALIWGEQVIRWYLGFYNISISWKVHCYIVSLLHC